MQLLSTISTHAQSERAHYTKLLFFVYCRCAADHQRDAQYPFLDEQVVAYLQGLPMTLKVRKLLLTYIYDGETLVGGYCKIISTSLLWCSRHINEWSSLYRQT